MENCSTADWQTGEGGGEAGPSWMSGAKESALMLSRLDKVPVCFVFCFDRCQPPGIHMQVCSVLIVALGGTDNVRIWKKTKQKKWRRKSKGGGTSSRGRRRMSVWLLDSNKDAEAYQRANTARRKQDPWEPVMMYKLIKLVSAWEEKNATRFKRLSASPVELIAGKNNTQLTLCTVLHLHSHHQKRKRGKKKHPRQNLSGQRMASSLLLNKREYA